MANDGFIAHLVERGAQVILLDEVSTLRSRHRPFGTCCAQAARLVIWPGQGLLTPAVAAYLKTYKVYGTAGDSLEL